MEQYIQGKEKEELMSDDELYTKQRITWSRRKYETLLHSSADKVPLSSARAIHTNAIIPILHTSPRHAVNLYNNYDYAYIDIFYVLRT